MHRILLGYGRRFYVSSTSLLLGYGRRLPVSSTSFADMRQHIIDNSLTMFLRQAVDLTEVQALKVIAPGYTGSALNLLAEGGASVVEPALLSGRVVTGIVYNICRRMLTQAFTGSLE